MAHPDQLCCCYCSFSIVRSFCILERHSQRSGPSGRAGPSSLFPTLHITRSLKYRWGNEFHPWFRLKSDTSQIRLFLTDRSSFRMREFSIQKVKKDKKFEKCFCPSDF